MTQRMVIYKWLNSLGRYLELMGRTFQRPERMRMFFKEYLKEMAQLGVFLHGLAGELGAPGLIADDLPELAARAAAMVRSFKS